MRQYKIISEVQARVKITNIVWSESTEGALKIFEKNSAHWEALPSKKLPKCEIIGRLILKAGESYPVPDVKVEEYDD